MLRTLRPAVLAFAAVGLLSTAACQITTNDDGSVTLKPAKRFNGTPENASHAWTSGQSIVVYNDNGETKIIADSSASEVKVVGKPFAFDGEEEDAKKTIEEKLTLKVAEENGEIVVAATMAGSGSYGYDLEVHIPSSFDGALDVQQGNGDVEIVSVGNSAATRVNSDNGDITATKVTLTNRIELTTGLGDIIANILPTGTEKSLVHTDMGDLSIGIPEGANLTIQASAENGTVSYPEGWPANATEDKSQVAITLGSGETQLDVSTKNGDIEFRQ